MNTAVECLDITRADLEPDTPAFHRPILFDLILGMATGGFGYVFWHAALFDFTRKHVSDFPSKKNVLHCYGAIFLFALVGYLAPPIVPLTVPLYFLSLGLAIFLFARTFWKTALIPSILLKKEKRSVPWWCHPVLLFLVLLIPGPGLHVFYLLIQGKLNRMG